MTSSLKVVLYIHSTTIPKQQSICSHTSKCNYFLVVYLSCISNSCCNKLKKKRILWVLSSFLCMCPYIHRHSKVRSLSSKGLQLSYKVYTNEHTALTHICLSLQISVSSVVKSQLFFSLKKYINNASLRYSLSPMLTSYIIIFVGFLDFLNHFLQSFKHTETGQTTQLSETFIK